MTLLKWLCPLLLCLSTGVSLAAAPAGFTLAKTKAIDEDNVSFKYVSNDGSIDLNCTHYFDKPELSDWDVWCGKGTKMLRQFRVHFLVREYRHQTEEKSAYEILYWVIDRNQNLSKAFSSTSSWIELQKKAPLQRLSFSQGVENDYAYLTVELKP